MWPSLLIVIYCSLLIVASLAGGWLPSMIRLTHTRMQMMMSLVGGLMMGVALLHLLPHAVVETDSLDYAAWSCTLGLLAMFLTIHVFHVHQHAPIQEKEADGSDHAHSDCGHAQPVCEHLAGDASTDAHRVSWVGLLLGLGIHSVMDGVAVGASLVAGVEHGGATGLLGAGTFLAVLLHKPLDSLSITSVMAVGHWSQRAQSIVNLGFSLICPAGVLLTYFGVQGLGEWQHLAVGCALGFSAGVFLCISLADILPEIQFHRHDRLKLTAALLTGVALAFGVGIFEPEHAHDRAPSSSPADQHDDHDHDHDHDH
jgi:zinc and cadmium transporter